MGGIRASSTTFPERAPGAKRLTYVFQGVTGPEIAEEMSDAVERSGGKIVSARFSPETESVTVVFDVRSRSMFTSKFRNTFASYHRLPPMEEGRAVFDGKKVFDTDFNQVVAIRSLSPSTGHMRAGSVRWVDPTGGDIDPAQAEELDLALVEYVEDELNGPKWTRERLIDWLVWNDPNGVWRDEDMEREGWDPMTKEEAVEQVMQFVRETHETPEEMRATSWRKGVRESAELDEMKLGVAGSAFGSDPFADDDDDVDSFWDSAAKMATIVPSSPKDPASDVSDFDKEFYDRIANTWDVEKDFSHDDKPSDPAKPRKKATKGAGWRKLFKSGDLDEGSCDDCGAMPGEMCASHCSDAKAAANDKQRDGEATNESLDLSEARQPSRPAPRNPFALAARMRTSGGPMKHRLAPRGGARNDQTEYLQDLDDELAPEEAEGVPQEDPFETDASIDDCPGCGARVGRPCSPDCHIGGRVDETVTVRGWDQGEDDGGYDVSIPGMTPEEELMDAFAQHEDPDFHDGDEDFERRRMAWLDRKLAAYEAEKAKKNESADPGDRECPECHGKHGCHRPGCDTEEGRDFADKMDSKYGHDDDDLDEGTTASESREVSLGMSLKETSDLSEGVDPSDPEYASVEAFSQFLLDDDREEFSHEDLAALNQRMGVPVGRIRQELESYGFRLSRREPEKRVRGFSSNSHDRWSGPGSLKTHGGAGIDSSTGRATVRGRTV